MRIAIIGAMVSEVELLRERIEGRTTSAHAGKEFYTGTLGGADVVLTACGVGKVAAASRTQAMIDVFSPDRIIFTGIAGALDPRIEIGDIVVSTDCVQSDVNVGVFDYPLGLVPGFDKVGFDADPALRALAVEAIHAAAPSTKVYEGRVATCDQFVNGVDQRDFIVREFGAVCCEMEGAAVAQVAVQCGIPFVVIRAISDKANDDSAVDYPAFEVVASHQGADVVCEMCRRLAS
ncbi:MAG: 5'-methylthioadenosine/adenosylhomocysteine nucleosidase [Atopobiaceae bacterium]|nr:5'-methylthioadenosine/adenosylhomocysteine nucleosidase [Atopobiaceae bacterium]